MVQSEAGAALAGRAIEIAAGLGIELSENASPGGSDGNFAAAVGTPVIDGLGPDRHRARMRSTSGCRSSRWRSGHRS